MPVIIKAKYKRYILRWQVNERTQSPITKMSNLAVKFNYHKKKLKLTLRTHDFFPFKHLRVQEHIKRNELATESYLDCFIFNAQTT